MKEKLRIPQLKRRLRQAREGVHLSTRQAAESSGVAKRVLELYESEDSSRVPTSRHLFRFADVYEVSVDWLLCRDHLELCDPKWSSLDEGTRRSLEAKMQVPPIVHVAETAQSAQVEPASRWRLGRYRIHASAAAVILGVLLLGSGTAYVWWPGHNASENLGYGDATRLVCASGASAHDRSHAAYKVHNELMTVGILYLKTLSQSGGELGDMAERTLEELQRVLSGEVFLRRIDVNAFSLVELREAVEGQPSLSDQKDALSRFSVACTQGAQGIVIAGRITDDELLSYNINEMLVPFLLQRVQ